MPTTISGTRTGPTTHGWPTTWRPIRRSFRADRPAPHLAARGVDPHGPGPGPSSIDETREFLAIAEATPFISGVVGWVDLTDPAAADDIARLRSGPGGRWLVGIRHQVQDEPDPDWLTRPDVRAGIAAVGAAGLVYDLLVRPEHLPAALAAARALAEVRFVVDHVAKPPIASGELEPWASRIRPLGQLANVWCKLSGMATEADWWRWQAADLQPYVDHVLDVFGPGRIVFGSDWPLCLLAGLVRAGLRRRDRGSRVGERGRASRCLRRKRDRGLSPRGGATLGLTGPPTMAQPAQPARPTLTTGFSSRPSRAISIVDPVAGLEAERRSRHDPGPGQQDCTGREGERSDQLTERARRTSGEGGRYWSCRRRPSPRRGRSRGGSRRAARPRRPARSPDRGRTRRRRPWPGAGRAGSHPRSSATTTSSPIV